MTFPEKDLERFLNNVTEDEASRENSATLQNCSIMTSSIGEEFKLFFFSFFGWFKYINF